MLGSAEPNEAAQPAYVELPLEFLDSARIEAAWRYEPVAAGTQRVLPDGRMDLLAHCAAQPDGKVDAVRLVIAGPADRPSLVPVRPGTILLGVRFQIGWGGAVLGVDPMALCNRTLAGSRVELLLAPLAQRVTRASSLDEALAALRTVASALAARTRVTEAHRRALGAIERMQALAQTGAAPQARAEWSSRTLRRDVAAAAGLPLRTLAGILRFQRAMALLDGGAASLSELAVAAGYADQAHMTRAFRRFGGFTPALPEPVPLVRLAPASR
ncbi:helix-turn-helix domain-containing protein [Variovorax saccharolyticus]|uniref:helix-turn-helix domain-containing protein n=1 Tax=Variovorax saccharolyticus TaxID=3053516 RepID=UPI002578A466|nr:helix-turn-helix domain-containing protein [Variovorax sp. J31P216]MDM0023829.1 helix-turn-helix domain-containing protein [Variovorax sp. J31P216]